MIFVCTEAAHIFIIKFTIKTNFYCSRLKKYQNNYKIFMIFVCSGYAQIKNKMRTPCTTLKN
jgi:hypothetical protein